MRKACDHPKGVPQKTTVRREMDVVSVLESEADGGLDDDLVEGANGLRL